MKISRWIFLKIISDFNNISYRFSNGILMKKIFPFQGKHFFSAFGSDKLDFEGFEVTLNIFQLKKDSKMILQRWKFLLVKRIEFRNLTWKRIAAKVLLGSFKTNNSKFINAEIDDWGIKIVSKELECKRSEYYIYYKNHSNLWKRSICISVKLSLQNYKLIILNLIVRMLRKNKLFWI